MRATIHELTFGRSGEHYLTLRSDEDLRELYEALSGQELAVDIKKWKPKRSLDANAYAWVLIHAIASAVEQSPNAVYREAIRDIPGVTEVVVVPLRAADKLASVWEAKGIGWQTERFESGYPGCVNMILWYGSSTYDTKQMRMLIDRLCDQAHELGIDTMTPDERNKLKGLIDNG